MQTNGESILLVLHFQGAKVLQGSRVKIHNPKLIEVTNPAEIDNECVLIKGQPATDTHAVTNHRCPDQPPELRTAGTLRWVC